MTSRPYSRSCRTASIRSGIAGGLAGELALRESPMAGQRSNMVVGRPTLAALPILLEGAHPDDAMLADGMLEDICRQLARFRTIRIISPVSSSMVAGLSDKEIAKRLGASHVLRCRLRRGRRRIQLSAILSDASNAMQVRSERLDVPASKLHTLEGELNCSGTQRGVGGSRACQGLPQTREQRRVRADCAWICANARRHAFR